MAIDQTSIDRKRANKIATFSSRYMSNAKWSKLFITLSTHSELIKQCLVKDIFDNVLRTLDIPSIENYNSVFSADGVKDVNTSGPYKFKEIEWLEFPAQTSKPFQLQQDLAQVRSVIEDIGMLEIEHDDDKLIVYGYK